MADFSTPFGEDGDRRLPTSTEKQQGFLCGPADRLLFNGLINRIEAEIGEVISHAGITPTDTRFTLLREAIEAMIAAATGGGTADDYILMTQARSRLPIYPDVLTDDGAIAVTSPEAGKIRVPGGTTFQHRGIYRVTTTETDFATSASKTYHLRWNATDGFALRDVASGSYNPTSAAESNVAFDSTYDDMLVARVVTNSSNVATITNLANRDRLKTSVVKQGASGALDATFHSTFVASETINWSRTPDVHFAGGVACASGGTNMTMAYANIVSNRSVSRYTIGASVVSDWNENMAAPTGLTGYLEMLAIG